MVGRERQVLTIVRELGTVADEERIARHMGVSPAYARQLLETLVDEGYIQVRPNRRYQLSRKATQRLNPWKGAVIASTRR